MTVSLADLGLYAFALLVLFLTPGPVWVALIARTLGGGFQAAWPLALGVVIGDMLWPLLAILSVSWVVSVFSGFMVALKIIAALFFFWMGIKLLRNADAKLSEDNRLMRPGMWAGFLAGLAVILGNPKAILFYMGVLPGFFDLTALTTLDVAAIVALSCVVPLLGNLILAAFVGHARTLVQSPQAVRRMNITAGALLIFVGLIIPVT
ncbi:MAG: LysE family translocator [Pseudomonadota bacterium]